MLRSLLSLIGDIVLETVSTATIRVFGLEDGVKLITALVGLGFMGIGLAVV
jgi:hypothetical protein